MKFRDAATFYTEMDKVLTVQGANWAQVLRKLVLTAPTPNSDLVFSRIRSWNEYLRLVIVSWYLPEEVRALCQVYLEDKILKFGKDKASVVLTLLSSKPEMKLFIGESNLFKGTRHFFGFIQQETDWSKYRFHFVNPKKPKNKVRKKGYQDHGSRRPDHKWLPKTDYTLDQLQLEIEQDRKFYLETLPALHLGGLP